MISIRPSCRHSIAILTLHLLGSCLGWWTPTTVEAKPGRDSAQGILHDSLVEIEVNRKVYDYQLPWTRNSSQIRKSALFLGGNDLLTTADGLADLVSIRIQKNGRGQWYEGALEWIDYHANLAIVRPKDNAFGKGLKPVEFATRVTPADDYQIHRWRNGNMEVRKAEFNQFQVEDGKLSHVQYVQMELSSEINGTGWSEPVMVGNKVAGLLTAQNRNTLSATPAPFIRGVLEARKKTSYPGLGYFDFTWQPTENPDIHKFLGFKGETKGVVVIDGSKSLGQTNVIQPRDLILEVDGFPIDPQGNYEDPMYGHVLLENLSTRNRWSGDTVTIKIWRQGKMLDVAYKLPKADYKTKLLPEYLFDEEPEYLIMGGLVFQPLSNAYLRSWGDDWRRRSPFRLFYYNNEPQTPERPGLVFLSNILPDIYNIGYQDMRLLVIDKVNGKKIGRLADLEKALQSPSNGFHLIEFMKGDSLQRMVLDASTAEQATKRVLQRYGIDEDRLVLKRP